MNFALAFAFLLACGPADHWWDAEHPCPPGATLRGTPPQEGVAAPMFGWQVSCRLPNDALQGRSTSWWKNGQRSSDRTYERGEPQTWRGWDEAGRPAGEGRYEDGEFTGDGGHFYENGQRALWGAHVRGERHGVWQSWDKRGQRTGRVRFDSGTVAEILTGPALLILEPEDSFNDCCSDDALATSRSPDHVPVAPIAYAHSSEISLDGAWILELEDGAIPPGEQRGRLISKLYDGLDNLRARQVAAGISHSGQLNVSVDGDKPVGLLLDVLFTAGQAQYGKFGLVVQHPTLELPPFSGTYRGGRARRSIPLSLPMIGDEGAAEIPVARVHCTEPGYTVDIGEKRHTITRINGELDTRSLSGWMNQLRDNGVRGRVWVSAYRTTTVDELVQTLDAIRHSPRGRALYPEVVMTYR